MSALSLLSLPSDLSALSALSVVAVVAATRYALSRRVHEKALEKNESLAGLQETLLVFRHESTFSPVSIPFDADFDVAYFNRMRKIGMTTMDSTDARYYAYFTIYALLLGAVHPLMLVGAIFLWWVSKSDEIVYYSKAKQFLEEVETTPHPLVVVSNGAKKNVVKEFERVGLNLDRVVILATNGEFVDVGQLVEWWLKNFYKDWVFKHNHRFGYDAYDFKRMVLVDSDPKACARASCRYLDLEILPVRRGCLGVKDNNAPGIFHEPKIVRVITDIVRRQRI